MQYIHKCNQCGCGTNEYFYANGLYFCSEECLPYTKEEWTELCKQSEEDIDNVGTGNDDFYWTEIVEEADINLSITEQGYYFNEEGEKFEVVESSDTICFIPENNVIDEQEVYLRLSNLAYLLNKYRFKPFKIKFLAEML